MTDDSIFSKKMYQFKAAILHSQSSVERKEVVNLRDTRLFYLVIKLTKLLALAGAK